MTFNKCAATAGIPYEGTGPALQRIFAVSLLLILLASGCTSRQKTKEELVSEGIKLVQARDARGAIILFKNALDKDQNYFEARFQLAKAYLIVGKFDAADKELQKVVRQDPSSREVRIELARVMAQTRRPDEALKELAPYLGDDSADCDALEIAGWARAVKDDFPGAVTLLKKAATACGERPATALTLATVYAIMGNTPEAEKLLEQVIARDTGNRKAFFLLAEIQKNRNDIDAALRTLDRALQAHPGDMEAQYRKGILLIERADYDAALALSHAMIKQMPKRAEGHHLQGVVQFHKKQYNDAIITLQKSVQLQPNAATHHFLGLSHYFRNEDELAMGQFQKALDLQSGLVPSRVYLALLLLRKGRADDTVREAKTALSQDPENASAHNVLGSAYLAKGNYAEGLSELNKALELDPSLADVHLKKALLALKRGKGLEAEAELSSALRIKPEAQEARITLALYYLNTNEPAKASDVLKKGLRGGREDAVPHYLIAESYLRQNNISEAQTHLAKAKEADPKYDLAYLKVASLHLAQDKQEQASQELHRLLEQSPNNVQGLFVLASFAEVQGNEGEALKLYQRAADTGRTEGIIIAARYFQRTNDSEKAIKIVSDGIRVSPQDLSLYEVKGQLLLANKKYKEALATFEAMERVKPQAGFGYVVNTYLAMGEPAKALEKVRTEVAKDPTNLRLRAELSPLYLRMGNKKDALENARELVRKYPDATAGHLALAAIYQGSNEVDKGIETLLKASKSKDPAIASMLGTLYAQKKNYPAALEQIRKAEAAKGGSEQILYQKASLLHAMGKKKEAETEYQRLLQIAPNHVMALNNLAYLYIDTDRNLSQAHLYATRAFMLAPQNDNVRDTLGYVLLKRGKIDQSMTMLKKASEGTPNDPSMLYHLALAYKESGDPAKAAESLRRALALGDFPEIREARTLYEKIKKNGKS